MTKLHNESLMRRAQREEAGRCCQLRGKWYPSLLPPPSRGSGSLAAVPWEGWGLPFISSKSAKPWRAAAWLRLCSPGSRAALESPAHDLFSTLPHSCCFILPFIPRYFLTTQVIYEYIFYLIFLLHLFVFERQSEMECE